MPGNFTFHYHFCSPPDPRLDQVLALLAELKAENVQMSSSLTDLTAAQSKVDTAMDKAQQTMQTAVDKINELAGRIASAGTDAAALKAITDDLTGHADSLATASAALSAAVAAQSAAVDATPAPAPTPDPIPATEPVPDADPTSDTPPASPPI